MSDVTILFCIELKVVVNRFLFDEWQFLRLPLAHALKKVMEFGFLQLMRILMMMIGTFSLHRSIGW